MLEKTRSLRDEDTAAMPAQPGPARTSQVENCCYRENAKTLLRRRIDELRRKAEMLERLHDTLPTVMPPEADEALWDLLLVAR